MEAQPSPPGDTPWLDALAAVGVLAVGLTVLVGSRDIPDVQATGVGPRVFPQIVGVLTTTTGCVLLGQALRKVIASRRQRRRDPQPRRASTSTWRAVLVLLAAIVGYAAMLGPVGYWQATTVFYVVVSRVLGSRRLLRDAVIGLSVGLAVYVVFDQLLGVALPDGLIRWDL